MKYSRTEPQYCQQRLSALIRPSIIITCLAAMTSGAYAHPGHGAGFVEGFAHPLMGLDHLAAMLAVGLWGAQLGKRAMWALPAAFVGVMAIGAGLALNGFSLPGVEAGILASLFILGIFIATAARLPMPLGIFLVGLFALFHGHAHGAEISSTASGLAYGVGFILTTAMLHLIGVGLGLVAQKSERASWVRFAGVAVFVSGLFVWLA